jgi:hypothetical protein
MAFALCTYLYVRVTDLSEEVKVLRSQKVVIAPQPTLTTPAQFEVAVAMGRIQQYTHKLWWAGQGGNVPLVQFYLHEIEEAMEEVAEAGVVDEDVEVSAQMLQYGPPIVEAFADKVRTSGLTDFAQQYDVLMSTCNSCHMATKHPYLRVQVPSLSRFSDQVFTP